MKKIDWANFKSLVNSYSSSIQYIDFTTYYELRINCDRIEYQCNIAKTNPQNADQADFETNFLTASNKPRVESISPFAAKVIGTKKLYKRIHGVQQTMAIGNNTILFTIPYNWVKITGVEIINGDNLDIASFYVLDTTTGTYSGTPNLILNQFGYTVSICKDYYKYQSEFDADLYLNMQVKVVYNSATIKNIGINFILNEVK